MEKRIACREDIRKANRDSLFSVTATCFRATLTLDLEILRKEKQFVSSVEGVTDAYRNLALMAIDRLSDAIATVVQAIDVGVYTNKEGLQEAKQNLGTVYRTQERLAMTRLLIDRSITWMNHLMIRLKDIEDRTLAPEEITLKIDDAIACLEAREASLKELLPLEDSGALLGGFRQVQSHIKICGDLAQAAEDLKRKHEQTGESSSSEAN